MKNILGQKPADDFLHRLSFSTSFVEDRDVRGKRILDIGCGFGWFEVNASNRGANSIVGVEISEDDLATAKGTITGRNIEFKVASAIDLPFEDKSFDTVVCWEIIEHIPKRGENKMFSEIRRVLKDKGKLYLSAPHRQIISNMLDPAWWLTGHRHYSYEQLAYFAKSNGFAIEKYAVRGGWWEILGVWDLYISKWIFRRRIFFESFINKKIDSESEKDSGFAGIFVKFRAE